MKTFAIILSGSGVYDGSEIHEAVMSMLAVEKLGFKYEIFAPNKNQHHVINHLTGSEMNETRNILIESARIARGKIQNLSDFNPAQFNALILPGGYGAVKNLSNYAFEGDKMTVDEQVENAVLAMHQAKKPIGALCIAPVILAKIFKNALITIGNDPGTIFHIENLGSKHQISKEGDIVIDNQNLLFSTPCYMLDASISEIALSAENLIREMLKWLQI